MTMRDLRTFAGLSPMVPDRSDDGLVAQAIVGEQPAFAQLVERYRRAVYIHAYRLLRNGADADDAAQETFVRAYIHLTSYRSGSQFKVWLLTITTNWCRDQLRRRRTVPLGEQAPSALGFARDKEPEARLLRLEGQAEIGARLAELPPAYREVLILRAYRELSYAEIGQLLERPVSTVRMRIFRARRALASRPPSVATRGSHQLDTRCQCLPASPDSRAERGTC